MVVPCIPVAWAYRYQHQHGLTRQQRTQFTLTELNIYVRTKFRSGGGDPSFGIEGGTCELFLHLDLSNKCSRKQYLLDPELHTPLDDP